MAQKLTTRMLMSTMGLDAVEIVLRAEELYPISITDEEAGSVHTVGDFYEVICAKLNVEALPVPATPAEPPVITKYEKSFWFMQTHTPLPAPPAVLPWSPQSIWDCLVAIFVDRMTMEPEEIRYAASIRRDLGIN
ncbi:MAG: acyl carrier protein [Janthinobacterium lividum]